MGSFRKMRGDGHVSHLRLLHLCVELVPPNPIDHMFYYRAEAVVNQVWSPVVLTAKSLLRGLTKSCPMV